MSKFKKLELILLVVVIILAVFFRFWRIRDYAVFLGDEGRDMITMRQIFTEGHLPFLGPTASVGGFYLGPIYYWMAAPFLLLWRFDPVGPAYMVAALGVATVFLLYKILRETVGFWPAILTSSLYSVSPLIVRYSRSSWNPNPLPFFSLLMIYFLYLAVTRNRFIYFLLSGACFGIVIQLHYLAAILIVIYFAIVVLTVNFRKWPLLFLNFLLGFIITFSPFLTFEIRHNFPNFKTILEFVTRGSTLGFKTYNFLWSIPNTGNTLLEELTNLKGIAITRLVFWVLVLGGFFGLYKNWKDSNKRLIYLIGLTWFLGGLTGLRFYAGTIFDYYFGLMFVAPFLLAGLVIAIFWQNKVLRIITAGVVVNALVFFALNGFYRSPPNRLIDQTSRAADFIIEQSGNEPFNFALISDHNSNHAYRYFLEIKGHKPVELETMITNQLLIVCESKQCAPLGHPIWEIAGFGRAEIHQEWELPNIPIRVFRLIHWSGAPSPAGKPAIKEG